MSLKSIMDATPIEWKHNRLGFYVGSIKYTYLIEEVADRFILRWTIINWEEPKLFLTDEPQEIINKINELEGIK